jgi:Restriction endonuclease NaeI
MNSPVLAGPELAAVAAELHRLDPTGSRIAQVFRNTFDQLYDGQRTGRYKWEQLYKTERTHCGTLVEINLRREFIFTDGVTLDYQIGGVEVDCKYSQRIGGWMIPPEARDHVCVLASAADTANPTWNIGLVRAIPAHLNAGANRDAKTTLNEAGRSAINWLFRNAPLPRNVLLQLDGRTVDRIFAQDSGQKRVNELFRTARGKIVRRATVATVAQEDDYMKRVRANGGARTALKSEGILILGQFKAHTAIARALMIPVPGPGESVSVRVAHAAKRGTGVAEIGGRFWKVARAADPIVCAPDLPTI